MFGEMTAPWMFVALIETSIGSAMALYGWKQQESVSLSFGAALIVFPCLVHNAWILALTGLGVALLFFIVKNALS